MSCLTSSIESSFDIQLEKATFIGTALSAVAYGVHVTMFVMTFKYYPRRLGRQDWRYWSYLAFSWVVLCLATVGLALQIQWDVVVFIDHGNCSGDPFLFLDQNSGNAMNVAMTAIFVTLNWVVDALLLYRFCTIFNHRWSAWTMSAVMLLSLMVVGSMFIPDLAALGLDLQMHKRNVRCVAYLALSLSLNVTITFVILLRVIYAYRGIWNSFAGPTTCSSLMAVLTESATLYTVLVVVVIIILAVDSPIQAAFFPMLGHLQAVPPMVTILRLLERRSQASAGHLSVLQFKSPRGPQSPKDCAIQSFPMSFETTSQDHLPFTPETHVDLEAGKHEKTNKHVDFVHPEISLPTGVHIV